MRSIQRHLLLRLLVATCLVVGVTGAGLYWFVRARLVAQFDQQLLAEAHGIANMVLREGNGNLEFDFTTQENPEYSRGAYFQIWRQDGSTFARSPSLEGKDLPPAIASYAPANLLLPDGRPGRIVVIHFVPHVDADDPPLSGARNPGLMLAVARERQSLNATLRTIWSAVLLAVLLLLASVALAVGWTVRRGLRPLHRLARQADEIQSDRMDIRFPLDGVPRELRPISRRLNGLLDRLSRAFERERRFTADVAHELRTPIAELRTLAEVAIRWPDDHQSAKRGLEDALQIARQMEAIVTSLLSIARCEANAQPLRLEKLDAAQLLRQAWKPVAPEARDKALAVTWSVTEPAAVCSDPDMLLRLLENLLSNAVAHCPVRGHVEVNLERRASRLLLRIENDADSLAPSDLPHLFEPFWRKELHRSCGKHCGLGLTLVRAYAKVLVLAVRVDLNDRHRFTAEVEFTLDSPDNDGAACAGGGRLSTVRAM